MEGFQTKLTECTNDLEAKIAEVGELKDHIEEKEKEIGILFYDMLSFNSKSDCVTIMVKARF